jgi:hypothetical protein
MKTLFYLSFILLFAAGCGCAESDRTYQTEPANRRYFVPYGAIFTYEDSLGNQSVIAFGDTVCSFGGYGLVDRNDCRYMRAETCTQGSLLNSGDSKMVYSLISEGYLAPRFEMGNLELLSGSIGSSELIGNYTVRDSMFTEVRKFTTNASNSSFIKYVYYSDDAKIIQVRFSDGSLWDRVPN